MVSQETARSASMHAVNHARGYHQVNRLSGEIGHTPSPAPIAIIGVAGRFPGEATNAKNLWDLCCQGRSAWSDIPHDRFNAEGFFHPNPSKSGCVRTMSVGSLNTNDNQYSSIPEEPTSSKKMLPSSTPHSSVLLRARQRYSCRSLHLHDDTGSDTIYKAMDPQQRLLLETTYEAFENGKIYFVSLGDVS